MRMTEELKRKWVEALRSGEYKQGRHKLKSGKQPDTRYCCLGVLCDVAGVKSYDAFNIIDASAGAANRYPLIGYLVQKRLADLNDNQRLSFKDIASFIEERLAIKTGRLTYK